MEFTQFSNQKLLEVTVASKKSGRQCHFKIWLDCHKLKHFFTRRICALLFFDTLLTWA
jgi:hypothetical protein